MHKRSLKTPSFDLKSEVLGFRPAQLIVRKVFHVDATFVAKAVDIHKENWRTGDEVEVPVESTREIAANALLRIAVYEPRLFWGGVVGFALFPFTLVLHVLTR